MSPDFCLFMSVLLPELISEPGESKLSSASLSHVFMHFTLRVFIDSMSMSLQKKIKSGSA